MLNLHKMLESYGGTFSVKENRGAVILNGMISASCHEKVTFGQI